MIKVSVGSPVEISVEPTLESVEISSAEPAVEGKETEGGQSVIMATTGSGTQVIYACQVPVGSSKAPPPALPSRGSSLASKPPPPPPPVRRTAALTNPNAVTIGTLRSHGVNSIHELRRSMGRAVSEMNVSGADELSTSPIYGNAATTGRGGQIPNGGVSRSSVHPMIRSEYQNAHEMFGMHLNHRQKMGGGARSALEGSIYGNMSPAPPPAVGGGSHGGSTLEITGQLHPSSSSMESSQESNQYPLQGCQQPGWNKLTSIHKQFMQTLNEKLAQQSGVGGSPPVVGGGPVPGMSPKIMKRRSMSLPHNEMDDEAAYQAGLAGIAANYQQGVHPGGHQVVAPNLPQHPPPPPTQHMSNGSVAVDTISIHSHPLSQSFTPQGVQYQTQASYVDENPYSTMYGTLRRESSSSVSSGGVTSPPPTTQSHSQSQITNNKNRSRDRERRNSHQQSSGPQTTGHHEGVGRSLLNLFSGASSGSRSLLKGVMGGKDSHSYQNGSLTSSRTQSPDTGSIITTHSSSTASAAAAGTHHTHSSRRGSALTIASIDRDSLVRILNTKLAQKRQCELERQSAVSGAGSSGPLPGHPPGPVTSFCSGNSASLTNSPQLGGRRAHHNSSASSESSDATTITTGSSHSTYHCGPQGGIIGSNGQIGHGDADTDTDSGIGHHIGSATTSISSASSSVIMAAYAANSNSVHIIQAQQQQSQQQIQPVQHQNQHQAPGQVQTLQNHLHAELSQMYKSSPNVAYHQSQQQLSQTTHLQIPGNQHHGGNQQQHQQQNSSDTVTPTNQANYGSRTDMTLERDNMYKLMIGQLFFDGHQDLALQIANRAKLRPGSCTPSDRLLQVITTGMRDFSDEQSSSSNSRNESRAGSHNSLHNNTQNNSGRPVAAKSLTNLAVNTSSAAGGKSGQQHQENIQEEPSTPTGSIASYTEQLQTMPILPNSVAYESVYNRDQQQQQRPPSAGNNTTTKQLIMKFPSTNPFIQHWNEDEMKELSNGLTNSLKLVSPLTVKSLFDLTGSLTASLASPEKDLNFIDSDSTHSSGTPPPLPSKPPPEQPTRGPLSRTPSTESKRSVEHQEDTQDGDAELEPFAKLKLSMDRLSASLSLASKTSVD